MKNKKTLIIISVGLAIGLAAILAEAHVINIHKQHPASPQGPTEKQKQEESKVDAEAKKQVVEEKASDNTTSSLPNTASKSIELTAQQETNNTVTVFTKLMGYSSGTCELTITNGDKLNTQQAVVIYQSEFSSCAGFSVPTGSLGRGEWTLKLAVTGNNATESKSITYEVK